MQTIRRRESLIITDPKGELYRETAALAKAHGYVVKILNFRPKDTLHTDTCNYMSVLGGSQFKAQSFAYGHSQNNGWNLSIFVFI